MKHSLLLISFLVIGRCAYTQTVQINNLSESFGRWKGTLTYLDYSTGAPFSLLANINLYVTEDKTGYVMEYEYPKEPHANTRDTVQIQNNLFGHEKIIDFRKDSKGFVFVTEMKGEDGNDHQVGTLRHTYRLTTDTLSIIKEVKYEHSDTWVKRNEYLVNRDRN